MRKQSLAGFVSKQGDARMLDVKQVRVAAKENLEVKSRDFFARNPGATSRHEPSPGFHVVTVCAGDREFPGAGVSYEEAFGDALTMAMFFEKHRTQ